MISNIISINEYIFSKFHILLKFYLIIKLIKIYYLLINWNTNIRNFANYGIIMAISQECNQKPGFHCLIIT